jgi:hypothetical protein
VENPNAVSNYKVGNLTVHGLTTLSVATSIGKVNSKEIQMLRGLRGNVQIQLDDLRMREVVAQAGSGRVDQIIAGANVTVDDTDPTRPIISTSGGGITDLPENIVLHELGASEMPVLPTPDVVPANYFFGVGSEDGLPSFRPVPVSTISQYMNQLNPMWDAVLRIRTVGDIKIGLFSARWRGSSQTVPAQTWTNQLDLSDIGAHSIGMNMGVIYRGLGAVNECKIFTHNGQIAMALESQTVINANDTIMATFVMWNE